LLHLALLTEASVKLGEYKNVHDHFQARRGLSDGVPEIARFVWSNG
jgi:hypothetical protein